MNFQEKIEITDILPILTTSTQLPETSSGRTIKPAGDPQATSLRTLTNQFESSNYSCENETTSEVESLKAGITRINVLGSPITALCFNEQIATILKWAVHCESKVVCVANVHMVMEAYWRPELCSVLKSASLVTPDGMPLVWMLRLMGARQQNRVAGMDIILSLCRLAPLQNIKVFFLGSQQTILEIMRKKLEQEFPTLDIAGMESLPFRPLTLAEDDAIIQKINRSGAAIVFVSLGCPKQEHWMNQHRGKIQAVMIGVGGAFPVFAGVHKWAPLWVRNLGLEWCYRLLQEPRRLWSRYLKTIPPFVWLALMQLMMSKLKSKST